MTNPITPDTVRALIAKATPGPWRGDRYDGTVKYRILAGSEADPVTVLLVDHKNGTHGFGCYDDGPNAEHPDADEALVLAAPALALAYLDVCAERDRLARVLAVEGGDESAAPEGWGTNGDGWSNFEHSRHAHPVGRNAYINGEFVAAHMWQWTIDERVNGWLMRGRGGAGYAPTALEAMEAADRAGGSDV